MKFYSLIFCLVFLGCENKASDQTPNASAKAGDTAAVESVPVEVTQVQPQSYKEYGIYVGKVVPAEEVRLTAYSGGRVAKIFKDRGDKVKKGEKLCDIEGGRLQTNLSSRLIQERLSKEALERSKKHLEQGTASRTQVDRAQLDYLTAKQARIEAKKLRDGAYCVSPMNGVIVDRTIEKFDETVPNQTTFYIADMSNVKVTIGIPENEIDGYKVGQSAVLLTDQAADKGIEGKITSIAARVDNEQRTFQMDVEFPNTDGKILSGITGRVKALRFSLEDVVVVPTEAILVLASEKAVMVVEDGVARRKTIQIKSSNETESLVASGLEAGDQLIVTGQAQAVDGVPVKIISSEK